METMGEPEEAPLLEGEGEVLGGGILGELPGVALVVLLGEAVSAVKGLGVPMLLPPMLGEGGGEALGGRSEAEGDCVTSALPVPRAKPGVPEATEEAVPGAPALGDAVAQGRGERESSVLMVGDHTVKLALLVPLAVGVLLLVAKPVALASGESVGEAVAGAVALPPALPEVSGEAVGGAGLPVEVGEGVASAVPEKCTVTVTVVLDVELAGEEKLGEGDALVGALWVGWVEVEGVTLEEAVETALEVAAPGGLGVATELPEESMEPVGRGVGEEVELPLSLGAREPVEVALAAALPEGVVLELPPPRDHVGLALVDIEAEGDTVAVDVPTPLWGVAVVFELGLLLRLERREGVLPRSGEAVGEPEAAPKGEGVAA